MRGVQSGRRRLFNNRPMCFAALALSVGILIAQAFSYVNPLFRLIPFLLTIATFVVLLALKKARAYCYIPFAMLLGLISMCGTQDVYSTKYFDSFHGDFQGVVSSEVIVQDGTTSFYIDDVYVDGIKRDGECYVTLYNAAAPTYSAGDTVRVDGTVSREKYAPFDSYFAQKLSTDRTMSAMASGVYLIEEGKPRFPLSFALKVKSIYYSNTDEYTSSICQALLLGDKSGMDEEMYSDVQRSGLAHVFAVSGLHVTTLAGAIYWLLKKLKLNKKIGFFLVVGATFFYALLCSFTPSVVRAFVMIAVLSFADAFSEKYDGLSSLSFAAVLLQVFSPASLCTVGYLLSFFAVLGLMLFFRSFNKSFLRFNAFCTPKKFRGGLSPKPLNKISVGLAGMSATALSANVCTYPFVAYFFGSLPVLFLISSIVAVPYVMFMYLILIVITLFALVTTLTGSVGIMQLLFAPLRAFVAGIGSISFASVPVESSVVGVVTFLLISLVISRFVFLTKLQRVIVPTVIATFGLVSAVIISAFL